MLSRQKRLNTHHSAISRGHGPPQPPCARYLRAHTRHGAHHHTTIQKLTHQIQTHTHTHTPNPNTHLLISPQGRPADIQRPSPPNTTRWISPRPPPRRQCARPAAAFSATLPRGACAPSAPATGSRRSVGPLPARRLPTRPQPRRRQKHHQRHPPPRPRLLRGGGGSRRTGRRARARMHRTLPPADVPPPLRKRRPTPAAMPQLPTCPPPTPAPRWRWPPR